jgi:voltage-gated sodium channel
MYNKMKNFVLSDIFQNFIIVLIVINGITMGLETSKTFMGEYGSIVYIFDKFISKHQVKAIYLYE